MIRQLIADLRTTRRSSSNTSSLDAGEGSADEEPVQAAGRRRSKSRAKGQVTVDLSGQAASAAAAAVIEAFGDIVEVWRRKVLPSAIQAEVDVVSRSHGRGMGVKGCMVHIVRPCCPSAHLLLAAPCQACRADACCTTDAPVWDCNSAELCASSL